MSEYYVYRLGEKDPSEKWYCTGIPGDENPLGGIGYQRTPDNSPPWSAATAPTKEDAIKVVDYLNEACSPGEHFYEVVK